MVAVVSFGLVASACWSSEPDRGATPLVRIAFFQDLSIGSHVDLVSPSFLAFDRSVHDGTSGDGPQRGGGAVRHRRRPWHGEHLRPAGGPDPTYVLAVLAPFWEEPEDVGETLASGGVPTFSLSPESPSVWATGPDGGLFAPTPPGGPEELWRRFVPDQELQAEQLAGIIVDAVPETSARPRMPVRRGHGVRPGTAGRCRGRSPRAGPGPSRPPPVIRTPPSRPSWAGCARVVWIGDPRGGGRAHRSPRTRAGLDPTIDFAADAMKTVMPIAGRTTRACPMVDELTCPCRDVSTSRTATPRGGSSTPTSPPPGSRPAIYAAEAWDAGTADRAGVPATGVRDRPR